MTQIVKQINDYREQKTLIDYKISKLVVTKIPEFNNMWNTIGEWECKKSPIGLCIYDHMIDPYLDNCLYCGEPHERK